MGRCYEFGASIADGCEHAMQVGPEGGYCRCTGCGTRCEGRFHGCAAILARPGYKPVGAPSRPQPARTLSSQVQRATDVQSRPKPRMSIFGAPPAVTPDDAAIAEFRSMLTTLLE